MPCRRRDFIAPSRVPRGGFESRCRGGGWVDTAGTVSVAHEIEKIEEEIDDIQIDVDGEDHGRVP